MAVQGQAKVVKQPAAEGAGGPGDGFGTWHLFNIRFKPFYNLFNIQRIQNLSNCIRILYARSVQYQAQPKKTQLTVHPADPGPLPGSSPGGPAVRMVVTRVPS